MKQENFFDDPKKLYGNVFKTNISKENISNENLERISFNKTHSQGIKTQMSWLGNRSNSSSLFDSTHVKSIVDKLKNEVKIIFRKII